MSKPLSPEQKKRREEFATYLEDLLTTKPKQFNYGEYLEGDYTVLDNAEARSRAVKQLSVHNCNTAGCVAGHYAAKFYADSPSGGYDYVGITKLMRADLGLTVAESRRITEPDGFESIQGWYVPAPLLLDVMTTLVTFLRDDSLQLERYWLIDLCRKHGFNVDDY